MTLQALAMLCGGIVRRFRLVVRDFDSLGLAIEPALDRWVHVMMRQSVAVADVGRLTVRVLAYGMG